MCHELHYGAKKIPLFTTSAAFAKWLQWKFKKTLQDKNRYVVIKNGIFIHLVVSSLMHMSRFWQSIQWYLVILERFCLLNICIK